MTVVVEALNEDDLEHAAAVLAASFLDNPLEIAVFSSKCSKRRAQLQRLFARLVRASPRTLLGNRVDKHLS